MFTMGIDVGSASSKAVILGDNGKLVATAVVQAGTGSSGPQRALDELFGSSGMHPEQMERTIATGYGRYAMDLADGEISEITCHAMGVHFLFPQARTILDIGGQDAKAISINGAGRVLGFFMNEKCAAGTGRFLEVMARILEVPLDQMGEWDARSEHPSVVSSTCTVFAESEVISQLSDGTRKEDIIRGVHNSVVSRASGLLYRTQMEPEVVLTGGVAKNTGVVAALERELGHQVLVSPYAQLTGAIGAALLAREQLEREGRAV